MSKRIYKCVCQDCHWNGSSEKLLRAPNPFDATEEIWGCPDCKSINNTLVACDEPDCWVTASCGTPTPDGYRQTCSKHMPRAAAVGETIKGNGNV